MRDILTRLQHLVGERAVFIPLAFGSKIPKLPGWQKLTFAESQTADHQRALELAIAKGGNIGVLLGEPSEGLHSIDIDDDTLVEPFLTDNPGLRETLITRGARGVQIFFRPTGDYPRAIGKLLFGDGRQFGEWRANGGQSVIHGQHPSGCRYSIENDTPAIDFPFEDIKWPAELTLPWAVHGPKPFPTLANAAWASFRAAQEGEVIFDDSPCGHEAEDKATFPLEALPDSFRIPVQEVMRHYRVPALLPAICALVINSAAIGRGLVVKSNVRRTYANLYALIGAQSGTGKSVVFDEFMAPLAELQLETLKDFNAEQKPRAEAELKMLQREVQELLKFKKNQKGFDAGEDARQARLAELLQQQAVLEDKLEFASRLWCSDFTSEALAMLLAGSNEQMAVLSDEGGLTIYNMLGRYLKGDCTDDILLCKAKTVNSHAIDRVGRTPIVLSHPCVSLLLLVQPDLLQKAFCNERLLVGGFLARCLAADSKMEVQHEDERTLPEPDYKIMQTWNERIRSLVKNYRFGEEPCLISVEQDVRAVSRAFHNEIVDRVQDELSDVSAFAMRWVERCWEVALNLHSGIFEVDCYRYPLRAETFENAILIVRYFMKEQLEVLQMSRSQVIDSARERLEEVFSRNGSLPITLRDLRRRHGLDAETVLRILNTYPHVFGSTTMRRPSGGTPSRVVFLVSSPPPGWQP